MLTAKYLDTGQILDITKMTNPRLEIEKSRLVCRFCNGKMLIRQGLVRAKHFSHLSECTSDFERHPESPEHNMGKELIATHVKSHWKEFAAVKIEFEYPLPEIKRIADIAMVFPSGWVVVHEIQLATITNEQLQKRTEDYNSIGIDTFWWLGKGADSPANRKWSIDRYGYCLAIEHDVLAAKVKDLYIGGS